MVFVRLVFFFVASITLRLIEMIMNGINDPLQAWGGPGGFSKPENERINHINCVRELNAPPPYAIF